MIESPPPEGSPLEQLAYLIGKGSTVTRISESPLTSNGANYCFVEVVEPRGSFYVLHAYGHEANELYLKANEFIGNQKNNTSFVGNSNTNTNT
ncbi:MAG TPA: hypothetical protein VH500_16055 [Nitrososphaeraceae archaeon]|jgi:hypothetical protein